MRDILPNADMILKGAHYRITVLTSRLIRLEYSSKNVFVDNQTQTVVNRCFPIHEFRVDETEEELVINTEALQLKYDKQAFTAEGLQITLKGQYGEYSSKWNYGDNARDLKGTARTLDTADGEIPLEPGILSKHGWTVLDDSHTLLLDDKGWIAHRPDEQAIDIYFFGYGRDYLDCLKDFHHLTGNVPLLPRFALGNWWSRYYKYTEKTYLDLMERFRKEQIPFTVAVIDMDWHVTEVDSKYGTGWTGYTWNKDFFPDPERFMKKLHDSGMKVTLNVHPADGVRAYEDCYEDFAEYMGVDTAHEEAVAFDVGNPKFVKGYFDYVHHPLEEQGVDFWWIDWQQGTTSGVKGLDPLWMLNHYHYLDNQENHERGLIFSRYAGPGSHRYPIGFSGDTIITWDSLRFQPYFTLTASNIGYGWWSHDIGGHMNGIKNDELAARWLQFGVFSPIMRLHSTCNEFNGKEPWRYNLTVQTVMKEFLRLRHKMIPYLYTMNLRANTESIPLIQPLYYQNPTCRQAYQIRNEYYFGSELLVCPITDPADQESNRAVFKGWLPAGKWIDLFTGMIYEGGRNMDFYRGIENMPVLMKEGAIVVLDSRAEGNDIGLPTSLEVWVNVLGNGAFTLQEDDGREAEYVPEHWGRTRMAVRVDEVVGDTNLRAVGGAKIASEETYTAEMRLTKDARFVIEPAEGNLDVLPAMRKYTLCFYGVDESVVLHVSIDGRVSEDFSCEYDGDKGIWSVYLPETGVDKKIEIGLSHMRMHNNQKLARIFAYLDQAEMEFDLKSDIYSLAEKSENGTPMVYVISELLQRGIREEVTGPILEILSANI